MSRLRAAVALLFQLLLLQVSVFGGGMACAPEWLSVVSRAESAAHDGAEHAAGHAGGHAGGHAHGGHADHAARGSHAAHASVRAVAEHPAGTPASDHGSAPAHCAAASGCVAVAVDAPEVVVAQVAVVHGSVLVGRVSLPPSTHPAPEPPPPRA